ncbi:MAG: ribbon-helix-helix protein, CopG family [Acidimicrobiia bacterium]|nr:ribbon-helix-helix protein, CopG family [Acidimicrobiia bacterium]
MPKTRTTLTIDQDVLRAVKVRAARNGVSEGEVIEGAVRRALGFDVLERLWSDSDLDANEAIELALEAQTQARNNG